MLIHKSSLSVILHINDCSTAPWAWWMAFLRKMEKLFYACFHGIRSRWNRFLCPVSYSKAASHLFLLFFILIFWKTVSSVGNKDVIESHWSDLLSPSGRGHQFNLVSDGRQRLYRSSSPVSWTEYHRIISHRFLICRYMIVTLSFAVRSIFFSNFRTLVNNALLS